MELNATHRVALAIGKDNIVHARSSEGTKNTIDDSDNEIRIQPWYLMFIIRSPGRYPFCREYCIIFEKMSIFYSIGYRSRRATILTHDILRSLGIWCGNVYRVL